MYNAGNLRPVGQSSGFQSFDTPEEGVEAMRRDLLAKITGNSTAMRNNFGDDYVPSLRNLITTWAPPKENNTGNYINYVSSKSGLDPDSPLTPDDIDKFMPHMITMEHGPQAAKQYAQADTGNMTDATDTGSDDFQRLSDEDLDAQIAQLQGGVDDPSKLSDEELDTQIAKLQQNQHLSDPSIARTALDQSLQGATLGFGDEISDSLGAALGSAALGGYQQSTPSRGTGAIPVQASGPSYHDLLKQARDDSKSRLSAEFENNPVTAVASNIGGTLLTGGAGATTKAGTAIGDMLSSGNLAARMGKGALAGISSGALSGAGSADDGSALEGAEQGGIYGGIAGGALPVVGAALKKPLSALIDYGTDKLATVGAARAGEISKDNLSKPLQKVYDRLRADFPDDVDFKKALYSYGSAKDKSLIEQGGARTANLAEGAAQYPSGGAKANEFFNDATGAAPDKLKDTLSKTISPSTNFSSDVDALLDAGRAKAAPLYQNAFKANQSIKSPVINKILQTPEGKASLAEAVKNMQNEMARVAKPDPELTAMTQELSRLGMMDSTQGGVANGLKLKTLDYVKRSMDDSIKKAIRAGDDGEVRRITDLKNSLINETDKADKSGLYARARATSGDYLSTKKAMEDGLDFFGDDVENISRRMSNMNPAEKQAYRAGVVKTVRNNIDGKYDGQNVARLFQKPATRQKLQDLLPATDYQKLLSDAQATDNIFKLRNQITGNSRTAQRQIAAQEFDDAGQEVLSDVAKHGFKDAAYKKVYSTIKKTFDGLNDKSAGDVADILYETDPKAKYQIIKSLVNEANSSGSGLRGTQAGQKLKAFYSISDAIDNARVPAAPIAGGAFLGKEQANPQAYAKGGIVVNANPTEAQKEAGNYKKAHIKVHGLDIAIENPQGSIRRGKDKGGKEWQVEMPAHYGYIKGTTGADKDHIDVYIGDNPSSGRTYIIDQKNLNTNDFDEHKCFLGYNTKAAAEAAYKSAFSDGKGTKRMGHVKSMPIAEFKKWAFSSHAKKPIKCCDP